MLASSEFHLSPNVAAETGIHIGDGGLSIKRGGPHGHYQYEVTGHALEDQLYLIGTVMPTISAAYDLHRPGFYNARKNNPHKYPRNQIKLKASLVIEQLATFMRADLGISASCRSTMSVHEGRSPSLQQMLQVNRSEDIETWRREIGFSNPSHISRMMVFEALGECVPRTSIVDRLSFLCGYSSRLATSKPIAPGDLVAMVDRMTMRFGFPRVTGEAILQGISQINKRLGSNLNRKLTMLD